jgi:hypothetical protein
VTNDNDVFWQACLIVTAVSAVKSGIGIARNSACLFRLFKCLCHVTHASTELSTLAQSNAVHSMCHLLCLPKAVELRYIFCNANSAFGRAG